MELDLIKENESPLMERKRVSFMVEFGGKCTPNILEFRDAVAAKLKVKSDLVSIRHVYQRYGFARAKVIAHIYKTRETLVKLEKMKKAEKKEVEAAKKAAEEKVKAAAEAKKAAEEAKKAKVVEAEDGKEASKE
jgi:ribosomal protein S24E